MSYFVERDWSRSAWTPGSFPYTIYQGQKNIAGTRKVVTVTQTLRGARKVIRRAQAGQVLALAVYEFADLPDLRVSELAPS